jgi:hypothetical protein
MESIYKKFLDEMIEAEKLWRAGDYLACVTYPVVKDEKLLLRALENVHKSAVLGISTMLKFEYIHKRISLSQDTGKNLEIFFKSCSGKLGLNEGDCIALKELLTLGKRQKESGFEFSRKGKAVILDGNLVSYELKIDKIKEFLRLERRLIDAIRGNFES